MRRCKLLGTEEAGRWRNEAASFTRMLVQTTARSSPPSVGAAPAFALVSRWPALLAHAAASFFAVNLLYKKERLSTTWTEIFHPAANSSLRQLCRLLAPPQPGRGRSGLTTSLPKAHLEMSMSMSTLSQRENCQIAFYILQRLQNFKCHTGTNAKLQHQLQRYSMKVRSSSSKIFANIPSQQYFRRPMRLCPCGCKAKTLLIQRCPGSVAKYRAKFQWCRR